MLESRACVAMAIGCPPAAFGCAAVVDDLDEHDAHHAAKTGVDHVELLALMLKACNKRRTHGRDDLWCNRHSDPNRGRRRDHVAHHGRCDWKRADDRDVLHNWNVADDLNRLNHGHVTHHVYVLNNRNLPDHRLMHDARLHDRLCHRDQARSDVNRSGRCCIGVRGNGPALV